MKRMVAFALSFLMLFGLAGCGEKEKTPAFSETELTKAQSYAYEAIHGYQIDKSLSLLSAQVLFTEDVNRAFPNNLITKDWADVQDTRAIVLAKYGDQKPQETTDDGEVKEIEPSLVMAFFLNEGKKTVAKVLVSGRNGSGYATEGTAAGASGVSEEFLLVEGSGGVGYLRRLVAEAELRAEAFLAEHAEEGALAAFAEQMGSVEKTIEGLGKAEVLRATGNDPTCLEYWEELWHCASLREEMKQVETIESLSGSEQFSVEEQLDSDLARWGQMRELWKEYAATAKELADYEAAHGEELVPVQEAQAAFAADDWWDDAEYLRLCLGSETINQYDILLRQQRIYETSLAVLQDIGTEPDTTLREHMAAKLNRETEAFSQYSNAIKVYMQCVVNQENFLTENAAELSAYEAAEAAAREAAGENYAEDIEYIKVEITYEELLKQRNAHESAVKNSKAAADEIRTELNEELTKLEEKEAERQKELLVAQMKENLREYLSQAQESVSEYEAGPDQWGDLHPDFTAYQNEHLTYIVEHSNYTPKKNTGSNNNNGGMKYDPNDENYSSHDYDGDGTLSDQEFQDAFNDYVNKILEG